MISSCETAGHAHSAVTHSHLIEKHARCREHNMVNYRCQGTKVRGFKHKVRVHALWHPQHACASKLHAILRNFHIGRERKNKQQGMQARSGDVSTTHRTGRRSRSGWGLGCPRSCLSLIRTTRWWRTAGCVCVPLRWPRLGDRALFSSRRVRTFVNSLTPGARHQGILEASP